MDQPQYTRIQTNRDKLVPMKIKTGLSANKILASVFWDRCDVFYIDFLDNQYTINAKYYYNLFNKAKLAYPNKSRDQSIGEVILFQHKAP